MNKKDELSALLYSKNPDIILFNEILPKKNKLKKKLTQIFFNIDGYDFVIKSTTVGRGVIIYFKQYLIVNNVDVLNNHSFEEAIWIRIKLQGSDNLLVGNIYRSPSSTTDNNLLLNDLMSAAVDLKSTHLLVAGDFNYGGLNWELLQSTDNITHSSTVFIENIKDSFLYQHVTENTRHRAGQSPSRLDLIFSNEIDMVTDVEYLPPIGVSDHSCLSFKCICYSEKKIYDEPRPNFYKGDYPSLRDSLKLTNLNNIKDNDICVFWDNFLDILNENIDKHVPKSRPSNRAKKKPWLNHDAISAIKEKKRAWKSYLLCKTKPKFQVYAEKRNKATPTSGENIKHFCLGAQTANNCFFTLCK